jgi:hypothetical protein
MLLGWRVTVDQACSGYLPQGASRGKPEVAPVVSLAGKYRQRQRVAGSCVDAPSTLVACKPVLSVAFSAG